MLERRCHVLSWACASGAEVESLAQNFFICLFFTGVVSSGGFVNVNSVRGSLQFVLSRILWVLDLVDLLFVLWLGWGSSGIS